MSNTTLSSKGPKLNDRSTHGTNRDNLGITSTQTTMQDELCPVVNTVAVMKRLDFSEGLEGYEI